MTFRCSSVPLPSLTIPSRSAYHDSVSAREFAETYQAVVADLLENGPAPRVELTLGQNPLGPILEAPRRAVLYHDETLVTWADRVHEALAQQATWFHSYGFLVKLDRDADLLTLSRR